MIKLRFAGLALLLALLSVTARAQDLTAPVILAPVVRDGKPAELAAADGSMRPVLQIAPDSGLTAAIREVFATPFLKQALRLEGSARRFRMHEPEAQSRKDSDEWRGLAEPLYLLLSNEEGGFARSRRVHQNLNRTAQAWNRRRLNQHRKQSAPRAVASVG